MNAQQLPPFTRKAGFLVLLFPHHNDGVSSTMVAREWRPPCPYPAGHTRVTALEPATFMAKAAS